MAFDALRLRAYKSQVMQAPRISTPRRLWAALGMVLAGATALSGRAGEAVIFSDSEKAGSRLEESKPTPPPKQRWQIANPWDPFGRRGGSSLDAVSLPPFAPATPGQAPVAPLTEKEWQMLKERQNWMLYRRLGEPSSSERDVLEWTEGTDRSNSRTPTPEAPGARSKARQGWLADYYEQLSKNRTEGEQAVPEPLRNSGRLDSDRSRRSRLTQPGTILLPDGTPVPAGTESLRPVEAGGFSRANPLSRPPNSMAPGRETTRDLLSRPDRSNADSPVWLSGPLEAGRLRQDLWTRPNPPGTPSSAGPALEGVARILGSSPLGTPLASPSLGTTPLSSLDPVNAYADPTREALNPVRPVEKDPLRVIPSGATGLEPPERRRLLTTTPGVLAGDLPASTAPALSQPVNSASEERRSLHSIKVNLELPRRSF